MTDFLVVGAGFAGSVVAEQLASAGRRVLLVERREHIGGNAFDAPDEHGLLVHRYGPHIFHTNARHVYKYLSRFTAWRPYEHRVLAMVDGRLHPMPINRTTINALYGLGLDENGMAAYLEMVGEKRSPVRTGEDVVLNAVGQDLYKKFFLGYTRKHWGLDPSELAPSVLARIPVRTSIDDRYFTDAFQVMPADGYTEMFRRILDQPNIRVELGTDFRDVLGRARAKHVVFTGPIDTWFDHRFGRLPYRSIRFEHEHLVGVARFQPVAVVNYPNDHAFTRITEFKHLTGQVHDGTSIVREYPTDHGEPYYPIPRPENETRYRRYRELAAAERGVTFVGRLAQYRYYNMDQVVATALKTARELLR